MRRHTGQTIPPGGRLALLANDALGNFAVSSPVAQALRHAHPGAALHAFTGTRVQEIAPRCPWFDQVLFPYGPHPRQSIAQALSLPPYDLVVNLENSAAAKTLAAILAGPDGFVAGPCVAPDGRGDLPHAPDQAGAIWDDPRWTDPDLQRRHPTLHSPFIADVFLAALHISGPAPAYNLPQDNPANDPKTPPVPQVLLATTASLPEKLWPVVNWVALARALDAQGLSIGLLGAKPADQAKFWKGADAESRLVQEAPVQDLRGAYTLPQVVGALAKAQLVVTLDNGVLHLAASTPTPTIGLFRHGIHRLWAPPVPNLHVIEPGPNRTVADIPVQDVRDAINNFQVRLA